MWYDRASGAAVSAAGGGAALAVNGVAQFRPNATGERLARTTLTEKALAQTSWRIDLGSRLLDSNVEDYSVAGSSIRVIDFGNSNDAAMRSISRWACGTGPT
ncbi:hypothetical protein [Pseudorhodoferax sp. Leaf267]|uniref:hypothetical protein n=1 Tax=Pseudorhodoferax sp. Leaf267 TaxID=1736316 RepID=UPI0006F6DA09|nr:hypothetical protein [Pseudorhodoferax sp. Leaf267]KQP22751.1 hypothetical protein ASF43_02285 [Pseudorhodoferax sp. Leaf267]